MAMAEQHSTNSYFQTTHSRVDSKLHSDSSSEKVDDCAFAPLSRPISGGGLRRCAATRDLTSIGSNVNYCAKVSVEYMLGDASTPFHAPSWKSLSAPEGSASRVVVDNLETVRRFKKTLYTQLCLVAEDGSEDTWPELSLFRRIDSNGFEPIDGDQEALYMFALKDGDRVVLLVHESSSRSGSAADPVAQWVEAIRTQTEFEAIDG
ncbi:hypothetical protein BC939DRAFT_474384 [Gamsiella multidivaricata]|uniref:uncharacterized protein n=1 Tax=Gamsiella multidivaricata TaxID=101098 RepID=UPI002220AC52|nr:uncharacterized protein BC939DRAFT_474384 [Gamsiella multidivaricata]KAG0364162.1 hypothetical protein BGZ54_007784 [Gamsiella multidivaricata]KAI7829482.1 hypothetical protein BC939DRAFT_474384 [Gamsiella multidivaricata]